MFHVEHFGGDRSEIGVGAGLKLFHVEQFDAHPRGDSARAKISLSVSRREQRKIAAPCWSRQLEERAPGYTQTGFAVIRSTLRNCSTWNILSADWMRLRLGAVRQSEDPPI